MSSLLQSPALGEVKGWFSNLFNWKSHSYALGSKFDLWTTRREVKRILETLGVQIGNDEASGMTPLRCSLTDGAEGRRRVEFRVEFSVGNALASSPQPTTPHRLSHLSPNLSQAKVSAGKSPMQVGAYACAVMLVQEKGSVVTFRMVYRQLREAWYLDVGEVQKEAFECANVTPMMQGVQCLS